MPRAYGYQPGTDDQPGTPPSGPAGASPTTPRTHRLAITAQAPGERSTITLDDHDISAALRRVDLSVEVGHIPTATLHVVLRDATPAEATEARILVPDATRDALLALGWTAPAEPAPPTDAEPSHDPIEITPYLVVQQYRHDHRHLAWVVRCWGDGDCDGHLALDLSSRSYAEHKAREHLAAEHPAAAAVKEG